MDWMGLENFLKKFDLFGIQTHPISLNPHELRANRTSPNTYHHAPVYVAASTRSREQTWSPVTEQCRLQRED
jgi:hypothetical protein